MSASLLHYTAYSDLNVLLIPFSSKANPEPVQGKLSRTHSLPAIQYTSSAIQRSSFQPLLLVLPLLGGIFKLLLS
jgi:hypothetical protein